MTAEQAPGVDEALVRSILTSENVSTFFQPIVSVPTKTLVGFEAFSRGSAPKGVVDPNQLFHEALSPDVKVGMDRLCRSSAFKQFKPIHDRHGDLLLFVNINPDIIAHVEAGSTVLQEQVAALGIDPGCVVMELSLGKAGSRVIRGFVKTYRAKGFLLSLDRCCVNDPFAQVITALHPEFIKVDRSFYGEADKGEDASPALEMLKERAARTGSTILAQQVETEEDSIRLLSKGIHLQQGYYYTKDEHCTSGDPARMFMQKIIDTYEKYKTVKRRLLARKKERFTKTFKSVAAICSKFSHLSEDRFEEGCAGVVNHTPQVFSIFVLNASGVQVTRRVHAKQAPARGVAKVLLGSEKGMDHSMQDYVMYLDMGYEKFVTPPFLSRYSGENACLISTPVYNAEGERFIVCIELPYPG